MTDRAIWIRESHDQLVRAAAEAGFSPQAYEKVARLLDLFAGLNYHPYLRGRLALKGCTALNLFVFDVPRYRGGLFTTRPHGEAGAV